MIAIIITIITIIIITIITITTIVVIIVIIYIYIYIYIVYLYGIGHLSTYFVCRNVFPISFYLDSSDLSSPPQVVQASAAVALHWREGPEGSGQRTRH